MMRLFLSQISSKYVSGAKIIVITALQVFCFIAVINVAEAKNNYSNSRSIIGCWDFDARSYKKDEENKFQHSRLCFSRKNKLNGFAVGRNGIGSLIEGNWNFMPDNNIKISGELCVIDEHYPEYVSISRCSYSGIWNRNK